jgi:hypothetical protein
MPFTVSPSAYQGGNFLFGGLSSLGKGVGDAIQEAQNQNKMESYNDSIVQHAYQNGQITLEDLTKYRQMSHTSKTGYAAGLAANFVEDMKREQLAAAREERQAQAQLHQQQAAAFNFQPTEETKALARATGNELLQTGPGKWAPVPYSGSGQDEVVTDPLKINGNVIPGIGVNRKTGQYVYFGGLGGGGMDNTEIDPVTHAPFYRDPKGNKHFLTGQQVMAGQMLPQSDATPTPAPAGGMTMQDIWDAIGSIGATSPADVQGGASPTPAPTATPPAAVPAAAAGAATGAEIAPKRLDPVTAKQFLMQAGGDKDKARALAKAAGYVF